MNPNLVIFTLVASIAMIFAVYCGIKLYDISSAFVPILRHGAIPAGIIISLAAILVCARPTIEAETDLTGPMGVMMISAIVMMIFGFAFSIINDHVSKHSEEKSLSFGGPFTLDLLGGIITAIAVGCSVAMGSSFSMMAITAIALFLIKEKVALIYRYKDEWSRGKVMADIAVPLALIPLVSFGITFLCSRSVAQDAILISITCGYLAYHSAFHAYFLAKSLKK